MARNKLLLAPLMSITLILFIHNCNQVNPDGLLTVPTTEKDHHKTTHVMNIVTTTNNDLTYDSDGICSLFQDTHSASLWWTSHMNDILNASPHPQDPKGVYRDWTRAILTALSPEMLQKGVRARPYGYAMESVAEKLQHRIMNPDDAAPLQIVVVGGSVTHGQGCNQPRLAGSKRCDPTSCAWPSRLERLVNTLAGMELVQVYNLAVSATTLKFATPLVKYWFYPPELLANGGPDIIISSYSSNEQSQKDTTKSVRFANRARRRIKDFLTAATSASSDACGQSSPLVMFVDDYIGNFQDHVLGEMTFNKVVTEVAEWEGNVMHVSYADVVRRHVYADTSESTFTSPDWPAKTEVHFGMGGHVAIAWSVLYAMMDVFMGYCDNQVFEKQVRPTGVFSESVLHMVNKVPPPELTSDLTIQNVSREWQDNAARVLQLGDCDKSNSRVSSSPCALSFLAGVQGWNADELRSFLQPYVIQNKGWEAVMEYGSGGTVEKPGLIATEAKASMTLQLTNIDKAVRMINIQRIKSYGEKWKDSLARVTVQVETPEKEVHTTQFDVDGYHKAKIR